MRGGFEGKKEKKEGKRKKKGKEEKKGKKKRRKERFKRKRKRCNLFGVVHQVACRLLVFAP